MKAKRLLRRPRSRRSGTSWCRSPTTRSTRRTRAAYGLVSYWTAYLKANYPAEYMAALLTSVRDDKDKSALYLNECRRMGIKVLPPDVNESIANFTAGRHRHPLRPRRDPQRRRQRRRRRSSRPARTKGRFTSFNDFLARSPAVVCNKRTIESLIKAGAFDSLGTPGRGLVAGPRAATSTPSSTSSATRPSARTRLFGGFGDDADGGDSGAFDGAAADPARRVGQGRRCSPSSARCSASTSPTTRCSASSTSSPSTPTRSIASLIGDDGQPDGTHGHHRRADHRPAAQEDQEGQPLGDRDRRGPRGRHRVPVLPARPT